VRGALIACERPAHRRRNGLRKHLRDVTFHLQKQVGLSIMRRGARALVYIVQTRAPEIKTGETLDVRFQKPIRSDREAS
jgi:hypothetical protein